MPDRAVKISEIRGRAIVHLKAWRSAAPPVSPVFAAGAASQARTIKLAAGEWLLVSDSVSGPVLQEVVVKSADEQGLAAVDVSQALAVLRIEGDARDELAAGTSLDLHPRQFPAGSCTRTRLAQLAVLIDYVDVTQGYDLYVSTSYGPYLLSALQCV